MTRGPGSTLLLVTLVVATTLTGAPAESAPVFSTADLDSTSLGIDSGGSTSCDTTSTPSPLLTNKPIAENGSAVTGTQTTHGTSVDADNEADVVTFDVDMDAVGKVSSAGGRPSLSLVGSGRVKVATTTPTSVCQVFAKSSVDLDYTFTTTKPGFLDVAVESDTGTSLADFVISPDDGGPGYFEYHVTSDSAGATSSGRVFLGPSLYVGTLTVDAHYFGSTPLSAAPRPRATATFHLLGERLTKPTGKGKKYTVLPAARQCPKGRAKVKITSNKGRSVQIKAVEYFVDDKLVKKTGNTGPGSSVKLKGPGGEDIEVRAVTTLKNGKVVEASADYIACSA